MGASCLGYRHNCLVVYRRRARDLWRRTFWVVCIYCDEVQGPHRERAEAQRAADSFNFNDSLPTVTP
jgi:hypothetical protein